MALMLTFLGGAGTVTGSKYLLSNGHHKILIDCGLFQGFKALRLRNWAPSPVSPASISAVVLTHAHLDHSGYLPLLVKQGFHGQAHCTRSTAELCGILLPDSGHLQEQDADFANRHRFSKHHPALPLYTEEDAQRSLKCLKRHDFDTDVTLPGGARLRFVRAGHILGAASVVIEWEGVTVAFSGDIGRYGDPLMPDPITPPEADYLLMESTYGDRHHDATDPQALLADLINRTVHRGGTVIVPAFAVGRAQSMLYHLGRLRQAGRIPALLPTFLDSPMAIDATDIFRRHPEDHRLRGDALEALSGGASYVQTGTESKALTANPMPKVIISASGMATGGRVLHHLEHYAPDPRNTILFTGFQAGGTRGAAMVAGATDIKMHGVHVPVRAEVQNMPMLSAHADQSELLRWAAAMKRAPRQAFIVHGEPQSADTLRQQLQERLGWNCAVAEHGQTVALPDQLDGGLFTAGLCGLPK
jgi:metallo-beta-lactamase family protein